MRIEIVEGERTADYLKLLSNDELFAIQSGRYTCFGAFDESSSEPVAVLIARILPEFIHIVKIFTLPAYRRQGVASDLLKTATDLPPRDILPFYVFTNDDNADTLFLKNRGFEQEDLKYSSLICRFRDFNDIKLPEKINPGIRVVPAQSVPLSELRDFILSSSPDRLLRFPEPEPDFERFSEASLVCLKNDRISAAIILEEPDDHLLVTWVHGNDPKSLYFLLAAVKKLTDHEFEPDETIHFLICKKAEKALINKLFSRFEEHPVHVFQKKSLTDLERAREIFKEDKYAVPLTGIEIEAVADRYSKVRLTLDDRHKNAAGALMGAVPYTMADFAFAIATNLKKMNTVTLSSSIVYMNPCRGKTLFAEARCLKDGKRTCFYEVLLKDDTGTDIARVQTSGCKTDV
ncbi:MAG: GNAT family N-acetyltransferase [Lachnospiraceae bacterium]|nr:GNAT family N-acetyltransferase [Lachnospiraceae bacterium]